jgi:hypothetical protein
MHCRDAYTIGRALAGVQNLSYRRSLPNCLPATRSCCIATTRTRAFNTAATRMRILDALTFEWRER